MDREAFLKTVREKMETLNAGPESTVAIPPDGDYNPVSLNGALERWAKGAQADDVLVLVDDTITCNGKSGLILTADTLYYAQTSFHDPVVIPYAKIQRMEVQDAPGTKQNRSYRKDPDSNTALFIHTDDGEFIITCILLRKTPLKEIIEAAMAAR